jgi:hypothetical protein
VSRSIWLLVLALAACKSGDQPAPTQAPPAEPPPKTAPAPVVMSPEDLLAGKLPEAAPEMEIINAQCRICHSLEYLTQQRLGEPGWKKTVEKMRKFGATLTDEQAASLVAFAAQYWNPKLPGRTWQPGPPPAGALPK